MDTITVAQPAHTVPSTTRTRVLDGAALFEEFASEIVNKPNGGVSVPSGTTEDRSYRVSLGGVGRCGCPDWQKRRKPCKHIYAATIARAKGRIS